MTAVVTPGRTLAELVTERSAAARVFERFGLDYCCRGDRTLADACAAAGLDAAAVAAELEGLGGGADVEWATLDPPALAEHIVATHHVYLREELPLLQALAAKVLGVHGERHPELADVERLVRALWAEIEPHLDKEERVLFPAIGALFDGPCDFPFGTVANPIRVMIGEHDQAGQILAELRTVSGGFEPPAGACTSYRLLYERLAAVEHDTHVHIHKENHRLFPAALALEAGR
jgi:regulator of cell morphogenesis and NO signaling